MRTLGLLAALVVLLAATAAGAQPKTAIEKGSTVKNPRKYRDMAILVRALLSETIISVLPSFVSDAGF